MAGSKEYFSFLGPIWDFLSKEDRNRLGEVWKGYEQVLAADYQKFVENDLNIAIQDMLPFATERWLPYTFSSENQILKPALFESNQDLSRGVDLTQVYLIQFSINNGPKIEVDLRGVNPVSTTIEEIIQKFNQAAGFEFARPIFNNSLLEFVSNLEGPSSRITWYPTSDPSKNASEFILGLLPSDLPLQLPEFPWVYNLPYRTVAKIPELRTHIRDSTLDEKGTTFQEGVDYIVVRSNQNIRFAKEPPKELWAERTLFDEETPWHNFGWLMDIYDTNSQEYLNILRGLWFAFWNGPRPLFLRQALYLLFTLPTALEETTVTSVSSSEIVTESSEGVIRRFEVPSGLSPVVQKGEKVSKFTPLVDGIDVFDKVSLPGFIRTEIGRPNIQRFLTEDASRGPGEDTDETKALRMLEEHTFLPQIAVEAFVSPNINLGNVKTFLDAIQPLTKTFLFQVIVGEFEDEIPFKEQLNLDIDKDITPNVDSNQTTFAEKSILDSYETTDNEALNLDSDGLLFQESVNIEVKSFGVTIDQFDA